MRIGIDLGGTKIEIIALDDQGSIRLRRRITAPRNDYAATLQAITGLVNAAEGELACPATVGIAIPGAVSPASGLIKNANSTWLNGRPLQQDLEQALQRPLRLANDANCFAVSEAHDGAAAGHALVFGVILGTGTGGGIVWHGQPVIGRNAIAGEWGHNPLPGPTPDELPGPRCYCGRHGCIETWLSGPGLARDHQRHGGDGALDAAQIAWCAAQGDALAEATLGRYEQRLARALASVINMLDPDSIVLGGGVSNIERLYVNVPRLWSQHVFSDRITTPLVRHLHGDSSGVRGAAWLWTADHRPSHCQDAAVTIHHD
ncbi:MAG: ROK family protein [Gammaproteobacteria bacterium]|nr:ROK family protein [Gammaproteobacteria bacterium]